MFGVVMYCPAHDQNVSGMLRTAHIYGADMFCVIGGKYKRRGADTTNASRHMAVFDYDSWQDFLDDWRDEARLVAIENIADAQSASMYKHPDDVIYVLGSENQGLPQKVLTTCDDVIQIHTPKPWPLNVTTAGSIVLAYRFAANGLGHGRVSV